MAITSKRVTWTLHLFFAAMFLGSAGPVSAREAPAGASGDVQPSPPVADSTLAHQVAGLRQDVEALRAQVAIGYAGSSASATSAQGPGGRGMAMAGGGMDDDMDDMAMGMGMGGMGSAPAGIAGAPMLSAPVQIMGAPMMAAGMTRMESEMPMMDEMMMGGPAQMGAGAQGGSMTSAMPGIAGVSHLLHVGATGFFLDHNAHLALSFDQQQRLGAVRESALLAQATSQRAIEQSEQELWTLTGADLPDFREIERKVRDIERMRADQRISFIRAIGAAGAVLSDAQRHQVTGHPPPGSAGTMPPQDTVPPAGMSDHM